MGKPAATGDSGNATSRITLLLLVAMTGVAPISLYMLVPALPNSPPRSGAISESRR
jgi:DHA1 family bicyclomycin/chloramphenicol resistance-like MFS transporter